jgi:S-formylglutathione hydrolase FrmB
MLSGAALAAVAAGGVVGAEKGLLPGRSWLHRHLGPTGEDGTVPRVAAGHVVSGSFVSRARLGRLCGWTIAFPPEQVRDLPVAVVLHGRGNSHSSAFNPNYLGLDRFLTVAIRQGARPFALASVDGGETYWHARDSGEDAGAMVLQEFVPLLASHGLDVGRLGFLGWSMGGYGALRLAEQLGRNRVAGVAAVSPALWHKFSESAPGAFDDAADFADATVIGRQHNLDGIPLRVDCGEGDPFYSATRDYVRGFATRPPGAFEPGNHDVGYWRSIAPHQIRFLARAFATAT